MTYMPAHFANKVLTVNGQVLPSHGSLSFNLTWTVQSFRQRSDLCKEGHKATLVFWLEAMTFETKCILQRNTNGTSQCSYLKRSAVETNEASKHSYVLAECA